VAAQSSTTAGAIDRSIRRLGHVYIVPPPARRGPDRTPWVKASRTKGMTIRSLARMDAQRQLSNVVLPARVNRSLGQSPHCSVTSERA
jgi:hypothetical protein